MTHASDFLVSSALPGWFGKLPGMGDFAHRRLPPVFRDRIDHWLQDGLQRLRSRHSDWIEHYLAGPVWFFVLGDGIAGSRAWCGVLMPSVDGVGRYFPFIVAAECDSPKEGRDAFALATLQHWWSIAARAALEGLENDLDSIRFDSALQRLFATGVKENSRQAEATGLWWPGAGQSLWLTDPSGQGLRMRASGLPGDGRFDALFGHADEAWVDKAAQE